MHILTEFNWPDYANECVETQVEFRYPWIVAIAVSIGLWWGLWKLFALVVWG